MKYFCKICDWTGELPDGATKLMGASRSFALYRFADGSTHDLKPERTPKQKLAMHNRYHVGHYILAGCDFCEPTPELPVPEPTPAVEADPVEVVLSEEDPLGSISEVEEVPEPKLEIPDTEFHDNTMSYAFSKFKETNKNGR